MSPLVRGINNKSKVGLLLAPKLNKLADFIVANNLRVDQTSTPAMITDAQEDINAHKAMIS